MTTRSVLNELAELEPGQSLVYWTGHLAEACEKGDAAALAVRDEAWQGYLMGVLDLVQRRVGDAFDYLAVKRARVRPPGPSWHT